MAIGSCYGCKGEWRQDRNGEEMGVRKSDGVKAGGMEWAMVYW